MRTKDSMSRSSGGNDDGDGTAFTPSRLTLGRRRRGLSLSDLAEETGISRRTLASYESGSTAPNERNLLAIAKALRMPLPFFSRTDLDEIPLDAVSFRKLSKMTARQTDAAMSAARLAMDLSDWIDDRFRLPDADLPTLDKVEPEVAADMLRAKWGLGQRPISNMVHLLEAHGIRVFSLPEECAAIDAFSLFHNGIAYVFLNTRKSGERGRFDAAHELGHLVMHFDASSPVGRERENEAHRFAANFLMPAASVLAQGLRNAPLDRILAAKQKWKVSAMALAHRLHELGLSSEWHYRTTCVALTKMGYRKGEPDGAMRETSQVLGKVFGSLRKEQLTMSTVARDLGLATDELTTHIFGLTPTAVNGQPTSGRPIRPRLTVVGR